MRDWLIFCAGCGGQCCGVFPMPNEIFARHQLKVIRAYTLVPYGDDHVTPVTDDGFCVFLDRTGRCTIYADRPELCRLYGTIPQLQCTRLRGEPDNPIREAFTAPQNCEKYLIGPAGRPL